MIEILVRFYGPGLVQGHLDQKRRPSFGIWWRVDGDEFPSNGWPDFGVDVMESWADSGGALVNGVSRAEFTFQDGPYRIVATRSGSSDLLHLRAEGHGTVMYEWTCRDRDIVTALLPAVRETRKMFEALERAEVYVRDLRWLEQRLHTYVR